jgi:3-deoxy-D-manno-octulosonate 8-phosphate phosphatase (KDO 8-P phosphatase)
MRPASIRAVVLDVDGVLTDGTVWWGASGEEMKRFHFLDVMGISRARRSGLRFALISGEESPLVTRFAQKVGIDDVFAGCKDKARALQEFAGRNSVELAAICFMGDDVNDLDAMALAGVAAAPASAHPTVLSRAAVVTSRAGGNGAVRELLDMLVAAGQIATFYDLPPA